MQSSYNQSGQKLLPVNQHLIIQKKNVKLCNCTEEPKKNNSNNNKEKLASNDFGHWQTVYYLKSNIQTIPAP